MRRALRGFVFVFALCAFMAVPSGASAKTISVTQVITITATVPPARSIVVNEQGQMTKIYSNTAENVEPTVYINKSPGEQTALTPALKTQYDAVMAATKNKVGVAIDVPLPAVTQPAIDSRLAKLLSNTMSIASKPALFNW